MKYTTKQSDGSYRTIDTKTATIFEMILEIFLDWANSSPKKKKNVKRRR